MKPRIYTAGYGDMKEREFVKLLKRAGNNPVLVDIRSHPESKRSYFCKQTMKKWLPKFGIKYIWEPRLGGWRKSHSELADRLRKVRVDLEPYLNRSFPNDHISKKLPRNLKSEFTERYGFCWHNRGLYDFQWFMSTKEFLQGVKLLLSRSKKNCLIICCCEHLWWRCHRSMVADAFHYAGGEAFHLQPKITRHQEPMIETKRLPRYDPQVLDKWRDTLGCNHKLDEHIKRCRRQRDATCQLSLF